MKNLVQKVFIGAIALLPYLGMSQNPVNYSDTDARDKAMLERDIWSWQRANYYATNASNKKFVGNESMIGISPNPKTNRTDLAAEEVPYDVRFNEDEQKTLKSKGIYAEIANQYPKRFNIQDIIFLAEENILGEQAKGYDERFPRGDIIVLKHRGVEGKVASAYDKRFSATDVEVMNLGDSYNNGWEISSTTPERANSFSSDLSASDIRLLSSPKIDPKIVNALDRQRYNTPGIMRDIAESGITNANSYNTNIPYNDVKYFLSNKMTPEKVNPFFTLFNDQFRYSPQKVATFIRNGITPDEVKPVMEEMSNQKRKQTIKDILQ